MCLLQNLMVVIVLSCVSFIPFIFWKALANTNSPLLLGRYLTLALCACGHVVCPWHGALSCLSAFSNVFSSETDFRQNCVSCFSRKPQADPDRSKQRKFLFAHRRIVLSALHRSVVRRAWLIRMLRKCAKSKTGSQRMLLGCFAEKRSWTGVHSLCTFSF